MYMACLLSKEGYEVVVFEQREDMRGTELQHGRSINLSLSTRGIEALMKINAETQAVSEGMPMSARFVHRCDGTTYTMQYGTNGESLISVDRRQLNELLLNIAEQEYGVKVHFQHKLIKCDFENGEIVFERSSDGTQIPVKIDMIFGCDGAHSTVRKEMMRCGRFDYCQTYSKHGYIELIMPAKEGHKPVLEEDFLHIWPKCQFMLIALPNKDKSYTGTFFIPFETWDQLKTKEDILNFWDNHFRETIPLIGKDRIVEAVMNKEPLPLITIKCNRYHLGNNCVLLGDAAHAMLPFYGQGVNCGFEDCEIFHEMMKKYNGDFSLILPEFSRTRNPDAKAICDLSEMNYLEMSSKVNCKWFCFRKKVERFLHFVLPWFYIPLYQMVAFSRIPYSDVLKKQQRQNKIIDGILMAGYGITGAVVIIGSFIVYKYVNSHLCTITCLI
ncbi:kynurenine 3-monooxygenase-like isoform X2 [Ptychodera flava]